LISVIAGDTSQGIGIVGPTHWQRTRASLRLCVLWQRRYGYVRHRSTQQTSTQTQRNGEPSRETLAVFACGKICAQKRPRHGRRAGTARVGTLAGGALGGRVFQPRVLALGYEVGRLLAAIALGPGRPFRLRLCGIADGLSQHLAQLSLGLRRFPFRWLPLGHGPYVGMREAELNPRHHERDQRFSTRRFDWIENR
jgi:hypothetical protein